MDDNDVSSRVIREVADALDVDPMELDPLYETIDPDALNDLFRDRNPSDVDDRVEFLMEGCEVIVYGVGTIDVTPLEEIHGSKATDASSPTEDAPKNQQDDVCRSE